MFWIAPVACLVAVLLHPGVHVRPRRGRHRVARVPQHQGWCERPDPVAELRALGPARHRAIESA